ncbi:thiamine phosphate synthase [Segnochrobactraceae bacterium EtOH-i3]
MTLPRFYPVMPDADHVARMVSAGARLVQLRLKGASVWETRRQARATRDQCAAAGATLVLNDFWEIALTEGIGFVHLGQEDLDTADIPALKRAGIRIGLSTHDEAELDRALSCDPDYVALGPVWPTVLKQMKWGPQSLDRVRGWKARIGARPLVAIGGLTPERAPAALAAGADSLAVVTDLVTAPDPTARAREWIALTDEEPAS